MSTRSLWGGIAVRWGLPALLAVAGVVELIIGHAKTDAAGAGVVLLGSALMVWLIGYFARLSISSNADRDRDEQARDFLTEHGYWPGEGPADRPGEEPADRPREEPADPVSERP